MADINGVNLRQLTIVPDDGIPSIKDSAWPPDGKWVLAAGGGFNGSAISNPGLPAVLYEIPIRSYNGIICGDKSPELSYKFQSSGNHSRLH